LTTDSIIAAPYHLRTRAGGRRGGACQVAMADEGVGITYHLENEPTIAGHDSEEAREAAREELERLRAARAELSGASNKRARQKLTKKIQALEQLEPAAAAVGRTESEGDRPLDSVPQPAPAPAAGNTGEDPPEVGERSEAEARKRREANRKKRERAKAKKRAGQQQQQQQQQFAPVQLLCRAERRDAGSGRGQGLFVTEPIAAGEPVVRARPAISVVFDHASTRVCGLCFAVKEVQACVTCRRFAACAECRGAGLDGWHRHECQAFVRLPAGAKKGDTSTLRMLLRHKATEAHGEWCGASPAGKGKEELALLKTLQGDAVGLPPQLLRQLSLLTGVDRPTVEDLIFRTRTNAATLDRGGKAGCALSVHMGYTNHSCAPNAQATIDDDGFVCLRARQAVDDGQELSISYVDENLGYDERRKTLEEHCEADFGCVRFVAPVHALLALPVGYGLANFVRVLHMVDGFSCSCTRCRAELRQKLRSRR
jgi:hypothetical protein